MNLGRHAHGNFGKRSGWVNHPPSTKLRRDKEAGIWNLILRRAKIRWRSSSRKIRRCSVSRRDVKDLKPKQNYSVTPSADIRWNYLTKLPGTLIARLRDHVGETVMACGLVVEQRTHHQITGELMKFLTLADWTGIVETELFAQTYKNYGLATVRYPVLEVTATVEPFENGRGFSLRVLRAGKPRSLVRLAL